MAALEKAFLAGDSGPLRRLLAGDNQALAEAYLQAHGRSIEQAIRDSFPSYQHRSLVDFAREGRLTPAAEVRAMVCGVLGEDEDALFAFVEGASNAERQDIAADPQLRLLLAMRLNEAELARVAYALERPAEAEATPEGLAILIESRKSWHNNDEAAMLRDVQAWAGRAGPLEGDALEQALAVVADELDPGEQAEARALLESGGRLSFAQELDVAAGQTTLHFFADTDEERIYAAITGASPAERQALLADEDRRTKLQQALDGREWLRAWLLLESRSTGAQAASLAEVLRLIAEGSSPSAVCDAMLKLGCDDLALLSRSTTLTWLCQQVDDVDRIYRLLGLTTSSNGDPRGSCEVLVAHLEQATRGKDCVDACYRAVLAWQDAGGSFDPELDQVHLGRALAAVGDLATTSRVKLENALYGVTPLRWEDRLVAAGQGLGTADEGLEETVETVPDEVLLLEWSNLAEFAARAEGATAEAEFDALEGFVPDLKPAIIALLHRERDDATDHVNDLRQRLHAALGDPALRSLAIEAYGYVPTEEDRNRLRYAEARSQQEQQRDGWMNRASRAVMDLNGHEGMESEADFAALHLAHETGGSQAEKDAAYQEWLEAGEDYQAAKQAAAAIAGAVVGIGVGLVMTLATGGAAAGLTAQLVGVLCAGLAEELTEAAILGKEAKLEEAAQDLSLALFEKLAGKGLGKVATALNAQASAGEAAADFFSRLGLELSPQVVAGLADSQKLALETVLADFPVAYAKDVMRTEGLLRLETGGAASTVTPVLLAEWNKALWTWIQPTQDLVAELKDSTTDEARRAEVVELLVRRHRAESVTQLLASMASSDGSLVEAGATVAAASLAAPTKARAVQPPDEDPP